LRILYAALMTMLTPILILILYKRAKAHKEDQKRLNERRGVASIARPQGDLMWLHAASVGEAQSALILVEKLLEKHPNLSALVTTGTYTSAQLMEKRLPARAVHQFVPLDQPFWVEKFMAHWEPQIVIWMESELWPNLLHAIKKRGITAALVNARMSPRSFKKWMYLRPLIKELLSTFSIVLAQTKQDAINLKFMGARRVIITDNIKYAAAPLPVNDNDLSLLKEAVYERPLWVYASTHDGEEELACRLHIELKKKIPQLLTIIVPRHPNRRSVIENSCKAYDLNVTLRTQQQTPNRDDDIYIADTLGELGLFYKLAPIACIGRSFSNDGGGGHNPIEALQLGAAVLHGPHIQNLEDIYSYLKASDVAIEVANENEFLACLEMLLSDKEKCKEQQEKGTRFIQKKNTVLDLVLMRLHAVWDLRHV
jgi:3-deoxy-D-manno-octulosonic-acid transferase